MKSLVISETKGNIEGISFDSEEGLRINASLRYFFDEYVYNECEFTFPFNQNVPEKINLKTLRNAKIKVTVEIIEE